MSFLVSTVCLPQLQSYLDAVLSALNMNGVIQVLEDLDATWTIALACCGIAVCLGYYQSFCSFYKVFCRFLFMILTRFCAKIIVWLFIFSFIICLLGLGTIYIMKAENISINLYLTFFFLSLFKFVEKKLIGGALGLMFHQLSLKYNQQLVVLLLH